MGSRNRKQKGSRLRGVSSKTPVRPTADNGLAVVREGQALDGGRIEFAVADMKELVTRLDVPQTDAVISARPKTVSNPLGNATSLMEPVWHVDRTVDSKVSSSI